MDCFQIVISQSFSFNPYVSPLQNVNAELVMIAIVATHISVHWARLFSVHIEHLRSTGLVDLPEDLNQNPTIGSVTILEGCVGPVGNTNLEHALPAIEAHTHNTH